MCSCVSIARTVPASVTLLPIHCSDVILCQLIKIAKGGRLEEVRSANEGTCRHHTSETVILNEEVTEMMATAMIQLAEISLLPKQSVCEPLRANQNIRKVTLRGRRRVQGNLWHHNPAYSWSDEIRCYPMRTTVDWHLELVREKRIPAAVVLLPIYMKWCHPVSANQDSPRLTSAERRCSSNKVVCHQSWELGHPVPTNQDSLRLTPTVRICHCQQGDFGVSDPRLYIGAMSCHVMLANQGSWIRTFGSSHKEGSSSTGTCKLHNPAYTWEWSYPVPANQSSENTQDDMTPPYAN